MVFSNVGSKITPDEARRREEQERNLEIIARSTRRAERDVVEQGHESAATRFWFQRDGVFTQDPVFDKSVEAVKGRTSLPVKERVVLPDGSLQKVLGAAALECVRLGIFCAHCEERQPEDTVRRRESLLSLRRAGVEIPSGRDDEHCCYCGNRLGAQGDAPEVSPLAMTDEQKAWMDRLGVA